jgi:hypothetical protein
MLSIHRICLVCAICSSESFQRAFRREGVSSVSVAYTGFQQSPIGPATARAHADPAQPYPPQDRVGETEIMVIIPSARSRQLAKREGAKRKARSRRGGPAQRRRKLGQAHRETSRRGLEAEHPTRPRAASYASHGTKVMSLGRGAPNGDLSPPLSRLGMRVAATMPLMPYHLLNDNE